MSHLSRRRFLAGGIGASAACLTLPALARSAAKGKFRLGVITDVHHDVMHDGMKRLSAFLEAMREARVDAIVQLGDFCQPKEANQPFLDLWNGWDGPRNHVLGNHDMDGGFSREHAAKWFGMPGRYHAFDRGGIRWIVLDGNDPGGGVKGYARFIGDEQKAWLDGQLSESLLPVVVMIHQPLDRPGGVANQEEIRALLEKDRGPEVPGVAAVLCGHLHQDGVRRIGGIAHAQVNSASYVWLPGDARRKVYGASAHESHPNLERVAPYRDPLWTVFTLDHDAGTLSLDGRATDWVGPDPWQRGAPEKDYPRDLVRPAISKWSGPFGRSGE